MISRIASPDLGNFAYLAQASKNSFAVENGPPRCGNGPTSKELSGCLMTQPIFGSRMEDRRALEYKYENQHDPVSFSFFSII